DWVEEDNSFLLESRCFSEAVGIATFELDAAGEMSGLTHEWVLYNEADFARRVGVSEEAFMTQHGLAVREQVQGHVAELSLEDVLGVSPQRYSAMNPSLIDEASMYALWMQLIVPCSLVGKAAPNNGYAYITTTSLLENDVYPGDFTINDAFVTSPFVDEYFVVAKDVLGSDLITIYNHLQHYDTLDSPLIGSPTGWMHYVMYPTVPMLDETATYSLLSSDYDGGKVETALEALGMDQYEVVHFSYDSPHSCLMDFISNNWSEPGFFKWTC
ncbi:5'-Nucleotidase/apyrase, partial [Kipferlia bialata]